MAGGRGGKAANRFEKMDKAADKKAGIREDSKRDKVMDAKKKKGKK